MKLWCRGASEQVKPYKNWRTLWLTKKKRTKVRPAAGAQQAASSSQAAGPAGKPAASSSQASWPGALPALPAAACHGARVWVCACAQMWSRVVLMFSMQPYKQVDAYIAERNRKQWWRAIVNLWNKS